MRIIAGSARSLPLKTLEGMNTRPTTDKIKETLFNVLQGDIPGCYFLDLFAGSGQIGLEALSRGGNYAVFVENNRKAAKCIEENINFTKFDKQSLLMNSDVLTALRMLEGKYKFDVIFMDPPYNKGFIEPALKAITEKGILSDNGIIVLESDDTDFYGAADKLEILKQRKYGRTYITIYRSIQENENCNLSGQL